MSRRNSFLMCTLAALMLAACYPLPGASTALSPIATAPLSPVAVATEAPNSSALPPAIPPPPPVEAATIVATSVPAWQNDWISPDARWRATVFAYPCVSVGDAAMAYEELRLVSTASRTDPITAPLVAHQLRYCEGLGAIGLDGRFWSADSRYFYFTDAREGVPDGGCGPYVRPTLRVDTATLAVLPLGSGPMSPDRTRLATWQDGDLAIWDIETGEAQRVTTLLPNAATGTIVWSPDGRSLAYLRTENLCAPGRSMVARVDRPSLTQTTLLDTDRLDPPAPFFYDLRWDTPDRLRLLALAGEEWQLDLTTGELRRDE